MKYEKVLKAASILMILVLTVVILRYAKAFLIPLTFGALLSMLLLPVCVWMEKKRIPKAISALLSILLLVSFFAALTAILSWQAPDIGQNSSKIKQEISNKYKEAQEFVREKLGIPPDKQNEMLKDQQSSSGKSVSSLIAGIIAGIGRIVGNTILVLVYIFLMIYFRGHIKQFIIRLVPHQEKDKALDIVNRSKSVTQKYLTGLSFMIMCLWVMYSIGFSIAGLKDAVFFAVLCGVLEIVPFVGNITGTALTAMMAMVQGGGAHMVAGVLITYAVVQFIQSYLLQPLIVGSEVNIHPLFTIGGLIAGEMVWGIPGMILVIPVMGVIRITFSHIDVLKPYGEFMSEEKKEEPALKEKIKAWPGKIKGWFNQVR